MSFSRPDLLWALLALPLLWWLSRPPRPRRRVLSAHLEQWQLALRALKRRPPRGSTLRLLLLAVALAAATFAAAGPTTDAAPGPDRLVVLLDGSASMAARRGEVSGFARAKASVAQQLARVPDHVEVTLLRCGGDLRRRYGDAARALSDLGAPAGALDVDLAELAETLRDARTAVLVCTDGQGQSRLPRSCGLQVFGAGGDNAAVLDVRVTDAWPLPALVVEVDVRVCADVDAPLTVRARGPIEGREEREVLAWRDGEVVTARFELTREAAGGTLSLRAELPGDVLAGDDARDVELPPLPAPRIAVLADAESGPFAAVAAQALAAEVQGRVVAPTTGGEVGLLLIDGGSAELAPGSTRAMTFGARLLGGDEPEVWLRPEAVEWSREHPVTRGLDLSELRLDRAWRGVLPDGEALLWAGAGADREPLAVLVEGDGLASLHFAFRLQDGNLPLLAAFPQLLRRGFVRAYGEAAAAEVEQTTPPVGEVDLRDALDAPPRPLRRFGAAGRDLSRWCLALGLLALGLRAFVR